MMKGHFPVNLLLGVSLIFWGGAGYWYALEHESGSLVRIIVTGLNIVVGILILIRKQAVLIGSFLSIFFSLPSLICGGLMFKLAAPYINWGVPEQSIFVLGGTITITSFIFLGRSFAILPAVRNIVSGGLFRIIRHPSYFGELLMIAACMLAIGTYWAILLFLCFVPAIIFRIKEEEKLLSKNESYQCYKETVRWRLVPFIW